MSTNKDILKLEKAINYEIECRNISDVYSRVYYALNRKVKRIMDKYPEIGPYFNSIPPTEKAHFNEHEIEVMKLLNGWDIDVAYNLADYNNKLSNKIITLKKLDGSESELPAIRFRKRIIFKNPEPSLNERTKPIRAPFISEKGLAQSWSNPQINWNYNKHAANSTNPNSSKYYPSTDREVVEKSVFNKGIGFVQDSNPIGTMYLYATFDYNIGTAYDKPSNICKLQVNRIPSLKKGNVSIHGFPITKQELFRDLGKKRAYEVLEKQNSFDSN